ncbi:MULTISPECIES: hypothetical protein [unclassified Neptuniibacter]|uniref:hypothetical protein n=1 Tax=unclassified Neptuniibacter TaxID=2630693 RepID=UPI0025F53A36|nr:MULTISPECIES: hypothetical protein [unclassified Neptuniibacter]|tara:strand:- start:268 stop:561 length:294 start_codon:yes stop_codon:yes gene_type:complete
MDNLTAIAMLLGYWLTIGLLAQWCAKKALPTRIAFILGAITCMAVAGIVLGASSIYHGKLMLVSNSLDMTALIFFGLAIMGGWRCTDKVRKANNSNV